MEQYSSVESFTLDKTMVYIKALFQRPQFWKELAGVAGGGEEDGALGQ